MLNISILDVSLIFANLRFQLHFPGAFALTHSGLVTPYATKLWAYIGSGNGLLPDGTKPLPEPMLIDHQ